MNRSKIFEVLADQNLWFKEHDAGILRAAYTLRAVEKIKTGEIIVISGVRRSGKSVILLQIAKHLLKKGIEKKNILRVNFEDYRWENYSLELLHDIWECYLQNLSPKGKIYLFLDEVHLIKGWERFVRTLYEKKNVVLFVSGSSSQLLSKEYATLLSGRYVELEIYPLSFSEFLEFKGFLLKEKNEAIARKNEILAALMKYVENGAFPKVVLSEDTDLLRSYFETIIIKDVAERHKIKKIDKLRKLATFYFTNPASKTTFNSSARFLDLSLHTVERFSYQLQDAVACFFVSAFSYSLKSQEKLPKKVYAIDTGLSNAIGFKFTSNMGKMMENTVFLHLKRMQKEVYFYYEPEVDFVVKAGNKIAALIQVTYASNVKDIEKRETENLLKAAAKLKCKNLVVITWDYEKNEEHGTETIHFVPIWKWLLGLSNMHV